MTQMMKAAIADTPGDAEVLQIRDVPMPVPGPDEVRIRVMAFGLNKAESYNRQGRHGPFSGKWALGIEASGEIDLDPAGLLPQGQKVLTLMGGMMFDRHGSYAEYICVKRSNVIALDTDLEHEDLAVLPEAYLTVWGALDTGPSAIRAGQTLLVRGATSSVGLAAVTYARSRGLVVIATTRQESRIEKLKALGADHVLVDDGQVAGKVQEIVPGGVDKAIELVGAVTLKDTLQSVRKWGDLVFVGFLGGTPVLDQMHMMNDLPNTVRLSFFGSGLLGKEDLPLSAAPMDWIIDRIRSGTMPSIRSRTFGFDQIREAQLFLESNEAFGKIVVTQAG